MAEQIRQLELSAEAKQALQDRYQATNNRRWQERIQAVLLKGQGLTLEAISEVIPYSVKWLSYWLREYGEKGLEGICVWEYQGSHAHLRDEQQQHLKSRVSQTEYRRVQDVVAWVKAEWGIEYIEDGMREMLHNLGFSYQKGRIMPGKADGEAQVLFLKETFEPMKATLEAEDRYYFVDATHTPVIGYQWALKGQRPQVLSNSGRQRLNILGAYNSCQQAYVGFDSTDNINAESMILLYLS
ncbi:MAG: winged helix-turn-helix domain-containing protein [Anaerolineae bacterium]|nr:winged helix-turn-helix domain-containing protein [Anaerolineae bacterium]